MCYRLECGNKPKWAVKNLATSSFVNVCDEHLADVLRVSGLPAQVDPFVDTPTSKIKI